MGALSHGVCPQIVFKGVENLFFASTWSPLTFPKDIATGSLALDQRLKFAGARNGQVLHLFGGQPSIQLAALLGFCKGTCAYGDGSVFFDLAGVLTPGLIKRAGLSPNYNAKLPDDRSARFRVLAPTTPQGIDDALKALTASPTPPALVAIDGLPELLQRQYLKGGTLEADLAKAGRVLYKLIQKAHLLQGNTPLTLWIASSPAPSRGSDQQRAQVAPPRRLATTIANTLNRYANYGVEFGRSQRYTGDPHFQVKTRVQRQGTVMAAWRAIEMWNDGQFKNP